MLISGFTVMVAMAGMFLAGNAVFVSFGVGTILVVAVAVLGSLTVLPAMLSWLGQKGWTEKGRVPYLGGLRHRNHGESRVWGAILDRVLKRPGRLGRRSPRLVLVALAVPAFGMHTINPGVAGLPRSLPIMQTYDRIQAAFPGGPLPGRRSSSRPTTSTRPRCRPGSPKLRDERRAVEGLRPAGDRARPTRDTTLAIVEPADGRRRHRHALGGRARRAARRRGPATIGARRRRARPT